MQCDICYDDKNIFYSLHNQIHPVCKQCFDKIKKQDTIICPFCRKEIYLFYNVQKITYI